MSEPTDRQTVTLPQGEIRYREVGTGDPIVFVHGFLVDGALWDALGDNPAERVAALVRFRCLIKVFSSRRLRELLMRTGYNLIDPAVQVAARMRLNADLGFNLLEFERALVELLGKSDYESALAA